MTFLSLVVPSPSPSPSRLLLLITSCLICATTATGTSTLVVVDLSYQPHLSSTQLSEALITRTRARTADSIIPIVAIDVSQSNILDHGLDEILQTLRIPDRAFSDTTRTVRIIDLVAQRNGLTAAGVTALGTTLLGNTGSNSNSSNAPILRMRTLDLGWNRILDGIQTSEHTLRACHKTLCDLIAMSPYSSSSSSSSSCLQSLRLSCTGAGPSTCRYLAKGLVARFEEPSYESSKHNETGYSDSSEPLSLDLSNNVGIGDAGAAAIAAAIRRLVHLHHYHTTTSSATDVNGNAVNGSNYSGPFLDTLDLSNANIGDTGVHALALALEDAKCPPVRRLLLAHNRITNNGALSLGRALLQMANNAPSISSTGTGNTAAATSDIISPRQMTIDLSGNPQINDRGIAKLLEALETGILDQMILRSCSIYADGAELVGKTLYECCRRGMTITLDLSGNPFGVLRGKSSSESGSSGYAASLLKSKATATASAYVTQGLSFLKRGLGQDSAESDDEEEKKLGADDTGVSNGGKQDNKRCGFKALANAFLDSGTRASKSTSSIYGQSNIRLGLRRTFCDTAGADALAAMILSVRDDFAGAEMNLGLELNPIVEGEMIAALCGDNPELLSEMAERHSDAMQIMRQTHVRAAQVANRQQHQRKQQLAAEQDMYDEVDDDWDEEIENENWDE